MYRQNQKFKIYRSISDDIVENVIFTEPQVSLTYKLRKRLFVKITYQNQEQKNIQQKI